MNLFDKWSVALPCAEFLTKYGSSVHQSRWNQSLERTSLTQPQRELLASFKRKMPVLCLAGAWCGDCAGQCPIFERFAEAAQQQDQLKALVAALERDNEQLRREVEELRTERAGVAEVLRALADDLNPTPDES